jgi:hypothetical protein
VISSVPARSVEVVKVATPLLFSLPVPKVLVPFLKVTVPVGMFADPSATVAVKVTDWPFVDGLSELDRLVVVAA